MRRGTFPTQRQAFGTSNANYSKGPRGTFPLKAVNRGNWGSGTHGSRSRTNVWNGVLPPNQTTDPPRSGLTAQTGSGFHQAKVLQITFRLRTFPLRCQGMDLGPSGCQRGVDDQTLKCCPVCDMGAVTILPKRETGKGSSPILGDRQVAHLLFRILKKMSPLTSRDYTEI